jgi:hypothetical protein
MTKERAGTEASSDRSGKRRGSQSPPRAVSIDDQHCGDGERDQERNLMKYTPEPGFAKRSRDRWTPAQR